VTLAFGFFVRFAFDRQYPNENSMLGDDVQLEDIPPVPSVSPAIAVATTAELKAACVAQIEVRRQLRTSVSQRSSPEATAAAELSDGFAEDSYQLFDAVLHELVLTRPERPEEIAGHLVRLLYPRASSMTCAHVIREEVLDPERVRSILTTREIEVLGLVLQDASIAEIASQLFISTHTAKHHMTNIGRKLSATGKSAIVSRARELGLLVVAPLAALTIAVNRLAERLPRTGDPCEGDAGVWFRGLRQSWPRRTQPCASS
jgi:DNA-binding CsgD family transcriptional regulator